MNTAISAQSTPATSQREAEWAHVAQTLMLADSFPDYPTSTFTPIPPALLAAMQQQHPGAELARCCAIMRSMTYPAVPKLSFFKTHVQYDATGCDRSSALPKPSARTSPYTKRAPRSTSPEDAPEPKKRSSSPEEPKKKGGRRGPRKPPPMMPFHLWGPTMPLPGELPHMYNERMHLLEEKRRRECQRASS